VNIGAEVVTSYAGMLSHLPSCVRKICVHTGNILNLNEVKKKAGQNPTDEVSKWRLLQQYRKYCIQDVFVM
jgi:hypothetical protein